MKMKTWMNFITPLPHSRYFTKFKWNYYVLDGRNEKMNQIVT